MNQTAGSLLVIVLVGLLNRQFVGNHCKSRFITGIIQLSRRLPDHRDIPGIIQRPLKIFQPCFNVSLIDIGHAHTFNTAPQLTVFCGVITTQIFSSPEFSGIR